VDDGQLGLALPFIGVGALATLRVSGSIADRYPRATLPVAIGLLGLVTLLPVTLRGTAGMVVSCLVIGAVSGAGDAAVNAEGARYEAAGGSVLTLGHGAFSAVVVVGSLGSAGLIATGAHRPWPLAVVGAAVVAAAVVIGLLPAPVGGRAAQPTGRRRWTRPHPTLLLLGGLGAVAYLVENAWQSWSAIHLHATLHASAAVAAAAPAVFAGCAASGRFASHVLQRRAGTRLLFAAGAAVAAAGGALAATAPGPALGFVGIALAGAGTSVCAPLLIAAAGRAAPASIGAATSTVISLAYLGFVFGPALVGLVADAASLRVALIATAAAAALLVPAGRVLPAGRPAAVAAEREIS
jgi:predicted MFS family arabinose efflux permease